MLFLGACNQQRNHQKIAPNKQCDTCYLKKLAFFVDTLNIDTSKTFAYYFNNKIDSLGNFDFKKCRGNYSFKTSLVLFWLKIDNVYLKHNWQYSYAQDLGSESKLWPQLVGEFFFLYTKKEPQISVEFLSPAWVYPIIAKDPSLLKNTAIKKLFDANRRFKSSKTKSPNNTRL